MVEEIVEYAIFMLDPDGCVASWNKGAERIKGYRKEEILGSYFSCFYTEEDAEAGRPEEGLAKAARDGRWTDEGWRVRKDGTRFRAHVTLVARYGEGGTLRGFAKVTRDMTEQHTYEETLRRREQALRKSERRYRRLFEEAQEGIGISTPEGEIIDANPAAEAIFGYSREELLAMNAVELYADPAERERGKELMAKEGAVRGFEARARRKDGTEIVCRISSTARRGPDGTIEAFQTFFRDVTEQKQSEEALRRSERRYRRVFEESRDAIVLTTPAGMIVDVNGAAEALFGYSRKEFARLDASELYADLAEREDRILPVLQEARSSRFLEAEMRHKDGHTFQAVASVTVHRDGEGHPELIQALVRDVTEHRRLQREVLRIQEEERRRLGQDLHDGVASQLTGIGMLLGTLSRRVENEATDADELVDALQEIQSLVQESCQNVRRFSRGLAPAGLSGKELPAALERMVENIEGGCFEKDADLPEVPGEVAAHLYWIAQEAATNARKYAGAHQIAIRLGGEAEAVVLEVEDDGHGFDVEEAEAGSLGLHTMRYRAELLGAALTVDTRPGGGTRVCCRLPV